MEGHAGCAVYGTWSQGFRPGGFNRGSGFVGGSSPLAGVFLVPIVSHPTFSQQGNR